jgi:hypothetical protein
MIEEIIARQFLRKTEFEALSSLEPEDLAFALSNFFSKDKNSAHDAFSLSDGYYNPSRLAVSYDIITTSEGYEAVAKYKKLRE